MAKFMLRYAATCIETQKFSMANQMVGKMRMLVQKFHDNKPDEVDNQYLFLGQIMMAQYL
jgi:hypothetical protein